MTVLAVGLGVVAVVALVVAALGRLRASAARADLVIRAAHDPLTGLPNRDALQRDLDHQIHHGHRTNRRITVLLLELTNFGAVNTTYGDDAGDEVLRAVAASLRRTLRAEETAARFGGPRFAVVCPDVSDASAADARAEALRAAVAGPFTVGDDRIRLTAAVGGVITDRTHGSGLEVLTQAVGVLRRATEADTSTVVIADRAAADRPAAVSSEYRVREALRHGQFRLVYLPVVALAGGEIVGTEALLRWADPERGLLEPAEFLPLLDRSGLIVAVGSWTLGEACRQARRWQERFPDRPLVTSINLAPRQLAQADLADTVLRAVTDSGVDADRLCLELTQGEMMHGAEAAWPELRRIKASGVRLALDDFGVGYASLDYLRRFRLDALKIDPAFIDGVADHGEDAAIVEHLVHLAHALGLAPVAEGVATPEQAAALRAIGCDFAQGYAIAPPQTPAQMSRLLEAGRVELDHIVGGAA